MSMRANIKNKVEKIISTAMQYTLYNLTSDLEKTTKKYEKQHICTHYALQKIKISSRRDFYTKINR